MKRSALLATLLLAAPAAVADDGLTLADTPAGPVTIGYRIIGTPVVGQPTTVDLQISSNIGNRSVTIGFRTTDTTAMSFPESQATSVPVSLDDDRPVAQQVTLIPEREGRLFLNVSAEIETGDGSFRTVTAIPIEVAAGASEPEAAEESETVP